MSVFLDPAGQTCRLSYYPPCDKLFPPFTRALLCSTTVFSHSQSVVMCGSCSTTLCTPTGGRARLTEGVHWRLAIAVCCACILWEGVPLELLWLLTCNVLCRLLFPCEERVRSSCYELLC